MDLKKQSSVYKALVDQGLYNPYNVFHHDPEFYKTEDKRYYCEVVCIKWNTKSTKMSRYLARFDKKKQRWVFARQKNNGRHSHGEKMR